MNITPIQTPRVEAFKNNLYEILETSLPQTLNENLVLIISSKIISLCEGSVVPLSEVEDKDDLIIKESEYYLPRSFTPGSYVIHTIKHNTVMSSAGIDASNAGEYYVLWPKDSYVTAKEIHAWIRKKYSIQNIGIVVTDSRSTPFRSGVTGISLGHYGFNSLHSYKGKEDLFGRTIKISKTNVADSLAAIGVFAMGEGDESTPLVLVEGSHQVSFEHLEPDSAFEIPIHKDVYGPFFMQAPWKRGGNFD